MDTLAGKTALVTGAGQPDGIGFATARILCREGARVAIAATGDHVKDRAEELRSEGDGVFALVADLSDDRQATGMVADAIEHLGQLDIVVNNAATSNGLSGTFLELDDDAWRAQLAGTLLSAVSVTRAALPRMLERNWGRIVMIASDSGNRIGDPTMASYDAAKAAMVGLTRSLAVQLGRHGITANAVSPGYIHTRASDPDQWPSLSRNPVGRVGRPEEVGELVAFLASDRAAYITGQSILIDGGASVLDVAEAIDSTDLEFYPTDPAPG
jgi:3-oxoacyl-[acyl-carrier protein] reductase